MLCRRAARSQCKQWDDVELVLMNERFVLCVETDSWALRQKLPHTQLQKLMRKCGRYSESTDGELMDAHGRMSQHTDAWLHSTCFIDHRWPCVRCCRSTSVEQPTIWHSNIYTIIRHVQETSEILPLSTVFQLVTTCTLTMLGALEVVRAAYCAL